MRALLRLARGSLASLLALVIIWQSSIPASVLAGGQTQARGSKAASSSAITPSVGRPSPGSGPSAVAHLSVGLQGAQIPLAPVSASPGTLPSLMPHTQAPMAGAPAGSPTAFQASPARTGGPAAKAAAAPAARGSHPGPRTEPSRAEGREAPPKTSFEALERTGSELEKGGAKAPTLESLYNSPRRKVAASDVAVPGSVSLGRLRKPLLSPSVSDGLEVSETRTDLSRPRTDTLVLPDGTSLTVEMAVTVEEHKRGMSYRDRVPAQGLLFVGESDAELEFRHKSVLVPVDYVFIDGSGHVSSVEAGVRPSPPGTPWREVPMVSGKGLLALVLPAGRAAELSIVPGLLVDGLHSLDTLTEKATPEELYDMLLAENASAPELFYADFLERRPDEDVFGQALSQLRAAMEESPALEALGMRNLLGVFNKAAAGDTLEDAMLRGVAGEVFPELRQGREKLARSLSGSPRKARHLPFLHLITFSHELGHYLAGRLLGAKIRSFHVFSSGSGVVVYDSLPESRWKRAVISLAGPALETFALLSLAALSAWAATALFPIALDALSALPPIEWLLSEPFSFAWAFNLVLATAAMAWTTLYNLLGVVLAPSGWHYDILNTAWDMDARKFASELDWREDRRRRPDGPHPLYVWMFVQTLLPHALDRQGRWDSPPK